MSETLNVKPFPPQRSKTIQLRTDNIPVSAEMVYQYFLKSDWISGDWSHRTHESGKNFVEEVWEELKTQFGDDLARVTTDKMTWFFTENGYIPK